MGEPLPQWIVRQYHRKKVDHYARYECNGIDPTDCRSMLADLEVEVASLGDVDYLHVCDLQDQECPFRWRGKPSGL